ncbi:hypothetical protein AC579_3307 [Pseudocercospora musae]|uniref:Uncharacterized protein n=1 Tax=Pseudocercospora musae TaxID=113226 RepID=A0A139IA96_9PEZI|nr:hypothetical protein AC579_3307 [Pseudocercospora musae]
MTEVYELPTNNEVDIRKESLYPMYEASACMVYSDSQTFAHRQHGGFVWQGSVMAILGYEYHLCITLQRLLHISRCIIICVPQFGNDGLQSFVYEWDLVSSYSISYERQKSRALKAGHRFAMALCCFWT